MVSVEFSEKPSMKKKDDLLSFEVFPTSTRVLRALYIGSRSSNHGKWQASCMAASVVFLISGHCSRLYLLFGPWQAVKTENANECLRSEHNIREASHFHFFSCEFWVLNLSYAMEMKFPLKWWALPFVQIVKRHWINHFSGKPAQP